MKKAKDLGHRTVNNILSGVVSVLESTLTKPLEDLKPALNKHIEYLISCDDFATRRASEALDGLYDIDCDSPRDLGIYVVEKGFGRIFSKMWMSLSCYISKENWNTQGFTSLRNMLITYMCYTDGSPELGDELIELGCCSHLLTGVDQLTKQIGRSKDKGFKLLDPMLGILQNAIRLNSSQRNIYRKENGVAVLQKCLDLTHKELKTDSLLILAYIVDESESQILSEKGVVTILVDLLRYAVQSKKHLAFVSTGYYTALELLDGLNRLAVNDDNKIVIQMNDGIPAIIRMMSDSFSDEEKQEAAKALWNMAFVESIRKSNTQKDMIKSLEKYLTSDNEELRKTCASGIWQLKADEWTPKKAPVPDQAITDSESQIMISYQWNSQRRAIQIRDRLVSLGYKVWMDVTHMKGDILSAMAEAVENSTIVLICMSEKYKESQNCRSEATYAYKLQKVVVPLLFEREYKPDGWLGILQGMDMYYEFHSEKLIRENFSELLKVIAERKVEPRVDHIDGSFNGSTETDLTEDTSSTTTSTSVSAPEKSSATQHSVCHWTNEDVQTWLRQVQLPELCPTLDFCDGSHLELLYEQHCQNPQGFKDDMKSEYEMTAKMHLQFTVALKKIFQKL